MPRSLHHLRSSIPDSLNRCTRLNRVAGCRSSSPIGPLPGMLCLRLHGGLPNDCAGTDAHTQRFRHSCQLRVVREARMDQGLGMGRSARVRWRLLGELRDLPLPGRARRPRTRPVTAHIRSRRRRERGPGGLDVDLGRRCRRHPPTLPQAGSGGNLASGGHAVGVREMHVRHPDGHVFRVGRGLEE